MTWARGLLFFPALGLRSLPLLPVAQRSPESVLRGGTSSRRVANRPLFGVETQPFDSERWTWMKLRVKSMSFCSSAAISPRRSPASPPSSTTRYARGSSSLATETIRSKTSGFDVVVSRAQLDRALRIMDALLKALEARGHEVEVTEAVAPRPPRAVHV